MNAAILNADLPISLRMKRANRRSWNLDRPDNIRFKVEGALAYRQLAAKLPWEGNFEQNRSQPAPFTSFGDESFALYSEAFVLEQELDDLNDKMYPGIGNQKQKLQEAIDYLYDTSLLRHEESMMTAFTKGQMLRVANLARDNQLDGYENLQSQRLMTMATGPEGKNFIIRQLAETLKLTAREVAHYIQESKPPSRSPRETRATVRRSSPPRVRSPGSSPDSVSVMSAESVSPSLGAIEETIDDAYGSMLETYEDAAARRNRIPGPPGAFQV